MNVKIDENLPASVVRIFVERGHAAETALEEGLAGASDERLAEDARKEERLLVTLDRGFADIRAYPPGSHPGIVVLRLPDQRPRLIDAAIRALLAQYDLSDLRGCTVVVQPTAIRLRRPPA